ncbi:hypothetical protein V4V35_00805 [Bacillus infantis]|uniref:hypothetical protein n=1 Tax=Bacillus infantis TaxID=324767 RepID=UPI002FBEAB3F
MLATGGSSEDIHIINFKTIMNDSQLKTLLIKKNYELAHQDNPVGANSLQTWDKLIFNEDTCLEGSFVLLEKHEILAYSLLHYTEVPNKLEFGWRGAKAHEDSKYVIFLTGCQIKYSYENNIKMISSEIDTTDFYSMEIMKIFRVCLGKRC